MAEQQEPIYINYGNDAQIEQNAFLNAAANNVLNYVSRLSWSNKRKELFMKAYSDIMQKGVIGADNSSGIWNIKHNGTIDLDSLSKKEREMYGEAAYYIQLQMSGLPTKLQQLEAINNEKLKLPLFDNKYFTEQFQGYIGNQEFGGQNWSKLSDWNILDEANKNGIRGTLNRANKLADMLQGYLGSLKEGEYNFEGTPFTDLNDFKTRVQTAIDTLRSGNSSEYRNVLNRIGLNVDDYLSTGENDIIGLDDNGNPVTRNQYIQMLEEQNRLLEEQNKLLLFEEAKKKQAEKDEAIKQQAANLYLRVNRLKSKGTDVSNLAKKYKNDLELLQKLIDLSVKNDRTPDEIEDIVGAYKFYNLQGKLENLSPDEIRRFKYLPSFKNISPNTLKKLKGIDNVYFDTRDNRVVIGIKDKTQSQQNEDLLSLYNPDEALKKYLQNTEWTNDLLRELGGIAADVASVIDPEPFSAGALALTGTGLRAYNRGVDSDGFTLTDIGHTALDAGLSLLGMIPVVGDAALAARVVGKLLKAAGWLGAAFAATSVPQAAKAAWNKVVNGQDMTVDDWRAIGNVLMGATQARRIQLNRAAGNAVKNSTNGTKSQKVGEVEVKINGKTEKVEIDEASAKELQKAYKSAGKDLTKTTEALRKSRKVREQLEAKKTSDGKPAYTKEQLDAIEAPQAAYGSVKGRIPIKRNSDIRGIKINQKTVKTEGTPINSNLGTLGRMRIEAIKNNKGIFNRGDFGWNMRSNSSESVNNSRNWFQRQWDRIKNPYIDRNNNLSQTTNSNESSKIITPKKGKLSKELQSELRETLRGKNFGTNVEKYGNFEINGLGQVSFINGTNGVSTLQIKLKDGTIISLTSSKLDNTKLDNLRFLKNNMKKISLQLPKDQKAKINYELIKRLKEVGALKQGGTIDKQKIQRYKEFILK